MGKALVNGPLKQAVLKAVKKASSDVSRARQAFTEGNAVLATANSGSANEYVRRFADSIKSESDVFVSTARFGLKSTAAGSAKQITAPELDYVELINNQDAGILDSFVARICFSIEKDKLDSLKGFRVFRAESKLIDGKVISKPSASTLTKMTPKGVVRKNLDAISNSSLRAGSIGIGNVLFDSIKQDGFLGYNSAVELSSSLRSLPVSRTTNRTVSSQGLISITGADKDVLSNAAFFINRRSVSPNEQLKTKIAVGSKTNVFESDIASPTNVVATDNSAAFKELKSISATAFSNDIGKFVQFYFEDATVIYGMRYVYYVISADKAGNESLRSRLVPINIEFINPPKVPSVDFLLVSGFPKFCLSTTSKFADHIEIYRRGGLNDSEISSLGSDTHIRGVKSTGGKSGYTRLSDIALNSIGNATFVDKQAIAGQTLDYRFYCVDGFGNKSQTPFSCSLTIPDPSRRIHLKRPFITAELAQGNNSITLSFGCDDERVIGLLVTRRIASNGENAWHSVNQPPKNYLNFKDTKRRPSASYPYQIAPLAWVGNFANDSKTTVFVDESVSTDKIYQYCIYGVDIFGNQTSEAISQSVRVSLKQVADKPLNIRTEVQADGDEPKFVIVHWDTGTNDQSVQNLIGDQDTLYANSVKSIYQVERRSKGGPWETMQPVTSSYFVDPVSTATAPKFRASYPKAGNSYDYRVVAMLSGGFISNYSDVSPVFVEPSPTAPEKVWVRSNHLGSRPLKAVVSWNYDGDFVDYWEVERCSTNRVFGSKISSVGTEQLEAIGFERIASVPREASRARSVHAESITTLDPKIFVGNRFFVDTDIDMLSSYFYKVRAVSLSGKKSDWVYKGIQLSDSPFERKFNTALTQKEKSTLSTDHSQIMTTKKIR